MHLLPFLLSSISILSLYGIQSQIPDMSRCACITRLALTHTSIDTAADWLLLPPKLLSGRHQSFYSHDRQVQNARKTCLTIYLFTAAHIQLTDITSETQIVGATRVSLSRCQSSISSSSNQGYECYFSQTSTTEIDAPFTADWGAYTDQQAGSLGFKIFELSHVYVIFLYINNYQLLARLKTLKGFQ